MIGTYYTARFGTEYPKLQNLTIEALMAETESAAADGSRTHSTSSGQA